MKATQLTAVLAAASAVTVMVAGNGSAAGAADSYSLSGFAAGVRVVGPQNVVQVSSEPLSTLFTTTVPAARSNATASVAALGGLVSIGSSSTDEHARAVDGGVQIVSHAVTGNVNLLNGAIKIGTVETTTTVTYTGGKVSDATSTTSFVGLKIPGTFVSPSPRQNSSVTIRGLANVGLNSFSRKTASDGTVSVDGIGLFVSLLRPVGALDQGALIFINPTNAGIGPAGPKVAGPSGFAYGSQITAGSGDTAQVESGRTAYINMGTAGTGGQDVTHSTTGIVVDGVTSSGVLRTTANGVKADDHSTATMTAQATGVNLLGGLVKASALKASASSTTSSFGTMTHDVQTTGVSVSVAGTPIDLSRPDNTVVDIANLGRVTIGKTVISGAVVDVTALDIVLTTAAYGLPAGAHIELARAVAWTVQ